MNGQIWFKVRNQTWEKGKTKKQKSMLWKNYPEVLKCLFSNPLKSFFMCMCIVEFKSLLQKFSRKPIKIIRRKEKMEDRVDSRILSGMVNERKLQYCANSRTMGTHLSWWKISVRQQAGHSYVFYYKVDSRKTYIEKYLYAESKTSGWREVGMLF